jgi:hypothetical protein
LAGLPIDVSKWIHLKTKKNSKKCKINTFFAERELVLSPGKDFPFSIENWVWKTGGDQDEYECCSQIIRSFAKHCAAMGQTTGTPDGTK